MVLSLRHEKNGNCKDVVSHYETVFDAITTESKTFAQMPGVESFGITGESLDLIWESTISIEQGGFSLCLEMSDSLLYAMQQTNFMNPQYFNENYPQVCMSFDDAKKADAIKEKLKLDANSIDMNSIQWLISTNNQNFISHHLEFDGFCGDVLHYYESAFGVKATKVIRYEDSPEWNLVTGLGAKKIYSAVILFSDGSKHYALMLRDTLSSAVTNSNTYNPKALLFYKGYNPLLTLRKCEHGSLLRSFEILSVGAKLNKKPEIDEDGIYHGSLIDKYGICWEMYSA